MRVSIEFLQTFYITTIRTMIDPHRGEAAVRSHGYLSIT